MISKYRWYLTLDGKAVRENHPDANSLLVAEGQHIDDAEATQLGVCNCPDEPDTKAQAAASSTKAITTKKTK